MRRAALRLTAAVTTIALVTACSSSGIPKHEEDQKTRDRYAKYAGPPIDRFTWLGRYDGWESVGENQLVVFTTPSDGYLITVQGPCSDLPWANGIALTSTGSTVSARLDSVKVKRMTCPISEIRKIDYARMRADMRAEKQQGKPGS